MTPDWAAAAQVLIDGCAQARDGDERAELLERLARSLGDRLYPSFLGVLVVIGERGALPAQQAVAEALVDALRSGRVPAGRRGAWGSGAASAQASALALGPVEYLCAWYAEPAVAGAPGGPRAPSASAFDRALVALLGLVGQAERARRLYALRLRALAADPLSGTLARGTRQALAALADAWERAGPQGAADAFMHAAPQAAPRPALGALLSALR
jgi:hypothetical protein